MLICFFTIVSMMINIMITDRANGAVRAKTLSEAKTIIMTIAASEMACSDLIHK